MMAFGFADVAKVAFDEKGPIPQFRCQRLAPVLRDAGDDDPGPFAGSVVAIARRDRCSCR